MMPSHQERRHARYKPCERGTEPHNWLQFFDENITISNGVRVFGSTAEFCTYCGERRYPDVPVPEPVS